MSSSDSPMSLSKDTPMSLSDTLVILTSAPTGLGHLRVMDAIEAGMPGNLAKLELGLVNVRANKIHSLGSRIPILTKITEFYQTNPTAEKLVAGLYISLIKLKNGEIKNYFREFHKLHPEKKTWITICTHFSLAYSIAFAKEKLEKELGIKIILCVVVTDDSPQRVWAVKNADFIFAPSKYTAEGLKKYLSDEKPLNIVSFPLSPRLRQQLSEKETLLLKNQLDPQSKDSTHIQIPISGAAVQLDYMKKLIDGLLGRDYQFTIIGQKTMYTTEFFEQIAKYPRVQVSIGQTARETVDYYESIFFQPKRPSLEITKPSEQIFKALLSPLTRGGVILLLTQPVGRQEKDNLQFLARHNLIPNDADQTRLEYYLTNQNIIPQQELENWRQKAQNWRAIKLPLDPTKSAKFIKSLKESGIFFSMLNYIPKDDPELKPDGVEQIWSKINLIF